MHGRIELEIEEELEGWLSKLRVLFHAPPEILLSNRPLRNSRFEC